MSQYSDVASSAQSLDFAGTQVDKQYFLSAHLVVIL